MSTGEKIPPILIACCGNPLAGDDAFGHLVAEHLKPKPPGSAQVLDLAMNPASLLDHVGARQALILVDAAQVPGSEPGSLIECDWGDPNRPILSSEGKLSTHGFSLGDQLELGAQLGLLPRVVRIVAVVLEQAQILSVPTDRLLAQVVRAVERVRVVALTLEEGLADGGG